MKFRYWMAVYPHQMEGDARFKPMPMTQPIECPQGAKIVSFEVDVPDNIHGAIEVPAAVLDDIGSKA